MSTNPIVSQPNRSQKSLQSAFVSPARGTSVVLANISWSQYEGLLDLLGDRPSSLITHHTLIFLLRMSPHQMAAVISGLIYGLVCGLESDRPI